MDTVALSNIKFREVEKLLKKFPGAEQAVSTAFFEFRQILQKFLSNYVQLLKPRSGGREKFMAGFAPN